MKVTLIGAGNLATSLALALKEAKCIIPQIYSRTTESAETLARLVNSEPINHFSMLSDDADVYIISIKDIALEEVIPEVCKNRDDKVFLHTAGTMSVNCFEGWTTHYGVFYPMQTFSRERRVKFKEIPVFLEYSDDIARKRVDELARKLTNKVYYLSSEDRKYLHLSAVWACNFVNHCYDIASDILSAHDIPFSVLLPLIDETARKVHSLTPREAQTGPAVRFDENVIEKQVKLMNENAMEAQLYQLLSESIHEKHKKEK
ncbi:DUF2520 domain-containing protein [Prevotella brunnea]|uniref:DUF2520 domain-containing protein n=1 Tax=Prevotella brunnea TaxID=2508867 RepID=A0A5C8GIR5_9BACT|nr:Rossmann-like and DUF2520 domain-containing protein [Prevotella brunnea]MDR0186611.1 DUF2520 domain-containing protein [Prevotella brunnea]TXJ61865.1 DUF2520 domain-containing protein [Prevotella brunnea]